MLVCSAHCPIQWVGVSTPSFRTSTQKWRLTDAELRVGIDDRSGSMGVEPYLGYEMRAMRGKDNNEHNKYHGSERERPMNGSKGK